MSKLFNYNKLCHYNSIVPNLEKHTKSLSKVWLRIYEIHKYLITTLSSFPQLTLILIWSCCFEHQQSSLRQPAEYHRLCCKNHWTNSRRKWHLAEWEQVKIEDIHSRRSAIGRNVEKPNRIVPVDIKQSIKLIKVPMKY